MQQLRLQRHASVGGIHDGTLPGTRYHSVIKKSCSDTSVGNSSDTAYIAASDIGQYASLRATPMTKDITNMCRVMLRSLTIRVVKSEWETVISNLCASSYHVGKTWMLSYKDTN